MSMTEQDYVVDCLARIRNARHFADMEVSCFGRSIDLVYMDCAGCLCSVEFKLGHKWKKALSQARDHQLGCSFSYVCIADIKESYSDKIVEAASELGVGLLHYIPEQDGWPFIAQLEAKHSIVMWDISTRRIREQLEGCSLSI